MPRRYDWDAIQREYRTGEYSLQRLSDKHGPSKSQISRKAAKEGWQKDLSGAVQQRTRELLSRGGSASPDVADEDLVEKTALESAAVMSGHRNDAARWRFIGNRFIDRLTEQLDRGTRQVQTRSGDIIDIDLDLEYIAKCMNNGTSAFERVVKLERQSYGMDEEKGDEKPPERSLSDDELNKRIKRLAAEIGEPGE